VLSGAETSSDSQCVGRLVWFLSQMVDHNGHHAKHKLSSAEFYLQSTLGSLLPAKFHHDRLTGVGLQPSKL